MVVNLTIRFDNTNKEIHSTFHKMLMYYCSSEDKMFCITARFTVWIKTS